MAPIGAQDSDPSGGPHPKELARRVGIVVLLILLLSFVIDNSHSVRVGFVVTDRTAPLVWVLVVTAALGAAIDRLVLWRSSR